MDQAVVVDIGGTNARFALARFGPAGPELDLVRRYATADHAGLKEAWQRFAGDAGAPLPAAAAIAVAGALGGETVKLTNSHWTIRSGELQAELGMERLALVNDFGAIAHAVDHLPDEAFEPIGGPVQGRPGRGVIGVIGPGTGLGVATIVRGAAGAEIVETEGGHIGFAPLDETERRIADDLAGRHGRVSVERVVSGPGLANIYRALASDGEGPGPDAELWRRATSGEDEMASAALDRFCLCFGAVAGDLALAHGASAVVLAGQLSQRIASRLRSGPFLERFRAKGRYRHKMESIPILLCRHDEPGLYGAAVAFQRAFAG